jgi:hypothetical protein
LPPQFLARRGVDHLVVRRDDAEIQIAVAPSSLVPVVGGGVLGVGVVVAVFAFALVVPVVVVGHVLWDTHPQHPQELFPCRLPRFFAAPDGFHQGADLRERGALLC